MVLCGQGKSDREGNGNAGERKDMAGKRKGSCNFRTSRHVMKGVAPATGGSKTS